MDGPCSLILFCFADGWVHGLFSFAFGTSKTGRRVESSPNRDCSSARVPRVVVANFSFSDSSRTWARARGMLSENVFNEQYVISTTILHFLCSASPFVVVISLCRSCVAESFPKSSCGS